MYETQGAETPHPGGNLDPVFHTEVSEDAGRATVTLNGELDLASAPELLRQLQDVLSGAPASVILDLGELTFVDSSGLGVLCQTRQEAQDRGIDLRLEQVPPHARRVLEVTGLTATFNLAT